MENLVEIRDNQVVVSSRQVAEYFGKEHRNILRDIENIIIQGSMLNFEHTQMFHKTTYINEQNKQQYPMYLMNKDGFSLLVMGFTGKEALKWKIKYIEAFNDMEQYLKQLQVSNVDKKILDCKYDEVQMEKSKLWLELADKVDIKEYKQMAKSYAFNTLAGSNVLPLPEVKELTYSATEVGEIFGVSKNKIGSLANKHNLKTDEY